jgi:hypothetical protein
MSDEINLDEVGDQLDQDVAAYTKTVEGMLAQEPFHYTIAEVAARQNLDDITGDAALLIEQGVHPANAMRQAMFDMLTATFTIGYELGVSGYELDKCRCARVEPEQQADQN